MDIWKGEKNMTNPKYSIIIGCYNQRKYLFKLIESLSNQTYKNFEVIFCDDRSTDGTKEFFLAEPEFNFPHTYDRPFFKKYLSGMMNRGIKKAKGEYCLFIMGDSFPELNYLEILNEKIDKDTIVCGVRLQIDGKNAVDVDWRLVKNVIPQHEAIIMNSPFEVLTGNGLAIPTEALRKYGGWDSKIKGYGGDDNILIGKMYYHGLLCKSVPDLILYHNWHKSKIASEKYYDYSFKQLTKEQYAK